MELTHIPLDQLKVSAFNMRHARKAPDVSDILPSIRARGVQQPLLVRPNGKGYEIVAGRRRFFSLKTIAKEGGEVEPVPCAVMADGDDAAALEASLIENIARLDPDEMAQYETFARLVAEGRTVEDIAATFGTTEIMVKRALALGNLLPDIREAYRAEEIDTQTIRQLTLASEAQQAEWLALFRDPEQYAPRGWQLKQWLFGGEIKTGVALFPLDSYTGEIVTDLFGEGGYFADTEQFWLLQNAAIAEKREALIKAGWDDVVVLDCGEHFHSWDHVKTAKKDGGRAYVEVRPNGEVAFHEGFITRKEHDKRLRKLAGGDATEAEAQAVRPELTAAAQNYIELHRHAAVRHALLSQPQLALRLMVAHAIGGSALWQTRPEPQKADKEITAESLAKSRAQAAFDAEHTEILKLLGLPQLGSSVVRSNGDDHRAGQLFATLIKLSDAEVMRALTFVMAETLQAGTCVIEQIGCHLNVDMGAVWEPDDAFFEFIRDKAAINAMLKHIGGKAVADGNVSATAKVQKKIVRDFLTGEGREKKEGWLPRYMGFPFTAYTKAGAGRLTENARRAKQLSS
ncbi:ParB/RepB/Spo0J family partition protein [Chelativorans sp. M5D2P16]|uniref:ParB/RepB/Spo0J family partition protein n=1 Tax=Chelativorans sp. M5D2P16 TaxID=3095678 RepID=UPI002AC9F5F7|nr:ParB/RepB/Spo0J family partition protein [Chelativorans sp. M5D2P16]MDZ5696736.1 ParB/RepB/Spo0J family partition protein [Chelativorans sp. M5D2P16]